MELEQYPRCSGFYYQRIMRYRDLGVQLHLMAVESEKVEERSQSSSHLYYLR